MGSFALMGVTLVNLKETRLDGRTLFKGRILRLEVDEVLLPNGEQAVREVARHPGGVCVLPLHADGTVELVKQFRYPYGEVILELPAGKLDPDEDPLAAAKRELSEETGLAAARWTDLGLFYPSVGFTDEVLHLYLAEDLSQGPTHPDEDEFLLRRRLPLDTLLEQVLSGAIPDGKTQVLVLKAKRYLETR